MKHRKIKFVIPAKLGTQPEVGVWAQRRKPESSKIKIFWMPDQVRPDVTGPGIFLNLIIRRDTRTHLKNMDHIRGQDAGRRKNTAYTVLCEAFKTIFNAPIRTLDYFWDGSTLVSKAGVRLDLWKI